MWDGVFSKLPPVEQVQLGLSSQHANSNFWRCLGFKLWYRSGHMSKNVDTDRSGHRSKIVETGKTGRKRCIELSQLALLSNADSLTHLHISNTSDAMNVTIIVLPQNLTYCFIERSSCLYRCTLPDGLTFLETNDFQLEFINLENHPNLRVLRVLENRRSYYNLLPNLIELEMYTTDRSSVLPSSLAVLHVYKCDLSKLPSLPNLVTCSFVHWSLNIRFTSGSNVFDSVRDLSFSLCGTNENVALMPTLFPNVTNLKIDCVSHGRYCKEIPIFKVARKLHLTLPNHCNAPYDPILSGSIGLDTWTSLVDLTLVLLSISSCDLSSFIQISIPPNLIRLEIKAEGATDFRVHFPFSLTHVRLESECSSVFNVSISEGSDTTRSSKLRTLQTHGNVFANKVKFPDSLRLFHVKLGQKECLDMSWHPLSSLVDFQVIREYIDC